MQKRLISLALAGMLVLAGCAQQASAPSVTPTPRSDYKVALVLNAQGSIIDGSFSESAYNGATRAGQAFNLTVTYRETVEDKDYPMAIQSMVDEGNNIIVTVGFQMTEATVAAAKANEKVFFIGVDQSDPDATSNYQGIQFAEDQSGFLMGALAGMVTQSNVVGVVGGLQIPPVERFVNGFVNGAKYVNPSVTALQVYTTSFADPVQGRAEADKMIAENADVIFGAGGLTGSNAIARAAERGKLVIGVDQDEFWTTFATGKDADKIISSGVKRVDTGVFLAIESIMKGEFKGGTRTLTAAECGITYAPFNKAEDKISPEVRTRLENIWRALAGGTLQTGAAAAGDTPPESLAAGAQPPVAENAPSLSDCAAN